MTPTSTGLDPSPAAPTDAAAPKWRARERLNALERRDKWYLSCGDGIIWAPPFPRWLDRPGFWDEAHIHHYAFAPLFSVALVGATGVAIPLVQQDRRWRPDGVTVEWRTGTGSLLIEERSAEPGGRFVSGWRRDDNGSWAAPELHGAHLVAFTAQPTADIGNVGRPVGSSAIAWERTLRDRQQIAFQAWATLGVDTSLNEWSIRTAAMCAEGGAGRPVWEETPFAQSWEANVGIGEGVRVGGMADAQYLYVVIDIPLEAVRESRIAFSIALSGERPHHSTLHAGKAGADAPSWTAFFDSFPRFSCSNPYLARYYDYRLYGLRLNRLSSGGGNILHPAVAEGVGELHAVNASSAQCHMWETRWARSADLAHGSLLNFLDHQPEDGSLHGRIYANHLFHHDFHHANWGDAVLAVDAVHDDASFLVRAYDGLSRYAEWLDRARDRDDSGLYDVVNEHETGQDYTSRYQGTDTYADREGTRHFLRLKGIDVTVYAYQLKRGLAAIAGHLGLANDASRWRVAAQRIGDAILTSMWDRSTGLFSDVDPRTMRRTRVKTAACFYPLLTDLLDDAMVARLLEHLGGREEFATPYPVPSVSRDDPTFSPAGELRGTRRDRPWNGPVWPITNSHVLEGLIRQWRLGRRNAGPHAARLLTRFVSMMFHERDEGRPNCYEHYNPITGAPSRFRGLDDHQHSWVLDLLIRGAAGLHPTHDGIVVDPLPLPLSDVSLIGAVVRGHIIDIVRSGSSVRVTFDGVERTTEVGVALEVEW